VAIGYLIVLAFVTSYRKITGKKSREEKESEAAKKIRIVLGHDLLDTAFTKPEELPGQKPKFVRPLPRYGSVNDAELSSDGNESESEMETEDESLEHVDEENLSESEKDDLDKKVEACVAVEVSGQPRPQEKCEDDVTHDDVTNDVTDSGVIGYDSSRTTSASSGRYSTASEMSTGDGRDSRANDTPALDTQNYERPGCNTQSHKILVHESLDKSIPDVAKTTINESGFFEDSTVAHSVEVVNNLETEKIEKHPRILEDGNNTVKTPPTYEDKPRVKSSPLQHDCRRKTSTSSYHIEIPPPLGKLKYSVCYMQERNELQVSIIKAVNLFHEMNGCPPSTFVKVSLLPQRFCWQKTKIIQATSTPVFNETFVISGFSRERFSNYTLLISVVNEVAPRQRLYADRVIGELYVPLSHVAKHSSNQEKVFCQWEELKPKITEVGSITFFDFFQESTSLYYKVSSINVERPSGHCGIDCKYLKIFFILNSYQVVASVAKSTWHCAIDQSAAALL
jgi:hypothetical protein